MNISEKLDKVLENQAKQEVRLDNFAKAQKEHHGTLYGNGKPGVVLDVDRLKIFKKVQCWICGVLIVAVVGLIVRLAYNHLAK
jgi:hypothetical protein